MKKVRKRIFYLKIVTNQNLFTGVKISSYREEKSTLFYQQTC